MRFRDRRLKGGVVTAKLVFGKPVEGQGVGVTKHLVAAGGGQKQLRQNELSVTPGRGGQPLPLQADAWLAYPNLFLMQVPCLSSWRRTPPPHMTEALSLVVSTTFSNGADATWQPLQSPHKQ